MRSVAVLKLFSYLSWSYWNISRFCKSHKDHANNFISYHPCNVNTHNLILKLWIKGKMWQVFVSLYKIRLEEVGGLFYVCFDNSVMMIWIIRQFYTISNDHHDHDHNEGTCPVVNPSQYTLQCSHMGTPQPPPCLSEHLKGGSGGRVLSSARNYFLTHRWSRDHYSLLECVRHCRSQRPLYSGPTCTRDSNP